MTIGFGAPAEGRQIASALSENKKYMADIA